jgi:hypothetical protein
MYTKDLKPVINVGTTKNPLMVLCATTMWMLWKDATGKTLDDHMDEFMKFCDKYRDEYNTSLEKSYDPINEMFYDMPALDKLKLKKVSIP